MLYFNVTFRILILILLVKLFSRADEDGSLICKSLRARELVESSSSTPNPVAPKTSKPVASSTSKPVASSTSKPVASSTSKPVACSTDKPTATKTAKPVASSTAKPVATKTAKPVASSTTQPSSSAPSTSSPTSSIPSSTPSAAPTFLQIDLGSASTYAIFSGTSITSAVASAITGDIGVSPGTSITGFPPSTVTGAMNTGNAEAASAHASLVIAYNKAASEVSTVNLSNQDLGGMTLPPGVYKFDTSANLNGILTLNANGNDKASWVFQIGSSMTFDISSQCVFLNGIGNADLVYWQVSSSATINNNADILGNILAFTAITASTGANIVGRLLALNAEVTLIGNTVTVPI